MIKVFKNSSSPKRKGAARNIGKKTSLEEIENRGRANLDKLNPMVIPLLSIANDGKSGFITSSIDAIQNSPHSLTENWINSLNSWVDTKVLASMLDEPDLSSGDRVDLGPLKVIRIIPPKDGVEFPSPALMLRDELGWQWYIKTSKAYSFALGDSISIRATVSGHSDGITFLKRASKVRKTARVME